MLAERALLYTLSFDLAVEHPYNFIIHAQTKLQAGKKEPVSQKVMQLALNFVNDRCIFGVIRNCSLHFCHLQRQLSRLSDTESLDTC